MEIVIKILYCAGNRVGANSQMLRCLSYLNNFDIKIAAYIRSSDSFPHINWTLDSLFFDIATKDEIFVLFGYDGPPRVNIENLRIFIKDLEEFEPDLCIIDGDELCAHVVNMLKFKTWYCSPLHLLDGAYIGKTIYDSKINKTKNKLKYMPAPDKIFIYSPFGDVFFRPQLNSGYQWIRPYHNKSITLQHSFGMSVVNDYDRIFDIAKIFNCTNLNIRFFSPIKDNYFSMESYFSCGKDYINSLNYSNWLFCTGETGYISDALYSGKRICVSPSLTDVESIINAVLVKEFNIGDNLGQIEYLSEFAPSRIENIFNNTFSLKHINKQNINYLHEEILWNM